LNRGDQKSQSPIRGGVQCAYPGKEVGQVKGGWEARRKQTTFAFSEKRPQGANKSRWVRRNTQVEGGGTLLFFHDEKNRHGLTRQGGRQFSGRED